MEFLRFDPTDCGFPKPAVPVLPTPSWQSLGRNSENNFRLLSSGADVRHYLRGRYALKEAYRLAGVSVTGSILVPAYHCRTMLDPAIRLGAEIAFYPLNLDLSPELNKLEATLNGCKTPAKALLITHYFGFAQDLAPIVDFCLKHGITLIEDCSHLLIESGPAKAAGSPHRGSAAFPTGRTGRFAIASPYKFVPGDEGGFLWANDGSPMPSTQQVAPSVMRNLKAFGHALQSAMTPSLSGSDEHRKSYSELQTGLKSVGRDIRETGSGLSSNYSAENENLQPHSWSRLASRFTNLGRTASLRRENYLKWLEAAEKLPLCQALFPSLAPNCVPYMFPLKLECPHQHFFALKRLGIPIWRWDDMAISNCEIAAEYRLALLHLPCHQEITPEQMTWMTQSLRRVFLEFAVAQ